LARAEGRLPSVSEWSRRLLFTIALVICAHLVQFAPMPWLDPTDWGSKVLAGGLLISAREASPIAMGALGFAPAMSGYGLVTIVYSLVPKLRASLTTTRGEARLVLFGLWLSAAFALLQSVGVGIFLHEIAFESPGYIGPPNPWLVGSTVALWAVLSAAVPLALMRWGLGWGMSAVVLTYALLSVTGALHENLFDLLVNTSTARVLDFAMIPFVVVCTLGAARRFRGDSPPPEGEPRLGGLARACSVALIAYVGLHQLGLGVLIRSTELSDLGAQVLELTVAVGGGLLLASGRAVALEVPSIPASKIVALGSFVLLVALVSAVITGPRLAFPWTECVIATLVLHGTWRQAQRQPVVETG
jgi:hypothetical protein